MDNNPRKPLLEILHQQRKTPANKAFRVARNNLLQEYLEHFARSGEPDIHKIEALLREEQAEDFFDAEMLLRQCQEDMLRTHYLYDVLKHLPTVVLPSRVQVEVAVANVVLKLKVRLDRLNSQLALDEGEGRVPLEAHILNIEELVFTLETTEYADVLNFWGLCHLMEMEPFPKLCLRKH